VQPPAHNHPAKIHSVMFNACWLNGIHPPSFPRHGHPPGKCPAVKNIRYSKNCAPSTATPRLGQPGSLHLAITNNMPISTAAAKNNKTRFDTWKIGSSTANMPAVPKAVNSFAAAVTKRIIIADLRYNRIIGEMRRLSAPGWEAAE
jgi:hypothetical protein